MPIKRVSNFIKSVPTRLAARAEYNQDTLTRVGNQLVKRKTPLKTYNRASTGIRGKKR